MEREGDIVFSTLGFRGKLSNYMWFKEYLDDSDGTLLHDDGIVFGLVLPLPWGLKDSTTIFIIPEDALIVTDSSGVIITYNDSIVVTIIE